MRFYNAGKTILLCLIPGITLFLFVYHTASGIRMVPETLYDFSGFIKKPQLTDRFGEPISVTYQNRWNTSVYIPIHDIPEQFKQILILSEDKRFFDHNGIDWYARFHALWQNIRAGKGIRGASTITEQVVRMIHIRPRTMWSRWLEGFESTELEKKISKSDILEFYMNQVPYASNRRGVGQAALFYFNRSIDTLSLKEMVALTVLVRAPSAYDLYKNPGAINKSLKRFAGTLLEIGLITDREYEVINQETFQLERSGLFIDARHFASHVYKALPEESDWHRNKIRTTLDGNLQNKATDLLKKSLEKLKKHTAFNGACLVSDHSTGEILVWAVASADSGGLTGSHINSVMTPRQPGSSLKPFLYCLSLEKGWTAATIIDDSSLTNPVGRGLHTYHNYSRVHYGKVTLRQALGNSLNIPAIKAIRFTGVAHYLDTLRQTGIGSLSKHSDFYGDGLALGNGEITLFELVQAYNVIANKGRFSPLYFLSDFDDSGRDKTVFSKEATSIISHILSDPEARGLEFGNSSILSFPVQTAVKTGTSNDYRDAWAIGYNHRFSAGVWMGNLDGRPMDGITGSKGPALVLRSVFAELNKNHKTNPLYLSPELVQKDICLNPDSDTAACVKTTELFVVGTEPLFVESKQKANTITGFLKPVNGLEMAMDPRVPDNDEAFEFVLSGVGNQDQVIWYINGNKEKTTYGGRYLWPLQKGKHVVETSILKKNAESKIYKKVSFVVK